MPRPVADGHLLARAEAWPFLSRTALSHATTCLRRDSHGLLDKPTRAVAEDLERDLQRHAAGRSLDTLASLRDHAWFDGTAHGDVSLGQHLCRLADAVMEPQGDRVALRQDGDFAARLEHQRWLSLFLPSDLLIAARYASLEGMCPPTDHLSLCTPGLTSLLHEGPVSETHVHLGAAIPFNLLWTGLMGGLRSDSVVHVAPLKKKLNAFGDPKASVLRLIAAAGTRLLLASYLRADERRPEESFSKFANRAFPRIAEQLTWPMGARAAERILRQMVSSLLDGRLPADLSLAALEDAYRRLAGPPAANKSRTLQEVARRDPLSTWLPTGPGRAASETQFLRRAIQYVVRHGANDEPFARVFWQYVRVRTILYKHLVQEPGTSGLDWFRKHYDRISPLRRPLDDVLFESGLTIAARDVRLGSFEGRTSPEPRWTSVRDMLRNAAAQAARFPDRKGAERPEVGLILHFLKTATTKTGRPHAEPHQYAHGARFGAWSYERWKEVIAIKTALHEDPRLLLLLRGIDVASAELSVPTWPLVPLFDTLRGVSRRVSDKLAPEEPTLGVRPLRVTCHAGEDYRRLVEGLRRIHELVETGILGAGDRIGHGLALGHDPELWARGAEVTFQPLEDRLDDLLWELDRYANGEIDTDASRLAAVSSETLHLAKRMFGPGIRVTLEDLREARRLRQTPRALRQLGYPFVRLSSIPADTSPLLLGYLTDEAIYHRGRVPLEIRLTSGERMFLKRAQRWLRTEIAKREITIESNPSSNFLIGDMLALGDHPSFRLQPLTGLPPDEAGPPLPLSVNSDDPVSFATSLADEYAHLYGALIRHGVGHAQALAWLEARRRDGHRSRFTLPASADVTTLNRLARPPR